MKNFLLVVLDGHFRSPGAAEPAQRIKQGKNEVFLYIFAKKSLFKGLEQTVSGVAESQQQLIQVMDQAGQQLGGEHRQLAQQIQGVGQTVNQSLNAMAIDFANLKGLLRNIPNTGVTELTPLFKKLEDKLDNRVHVFDVKRDPFTDLIDTVTVRVE